MDKQIQRKSINHPDYQRIYSDIIQLKYPEKKQVCQSILEKKQLLALDILKLNQLIFEKIDKETEVFNQKHRSYSKSDIFHILDFQKKHNLNNSQLANYFKLSRNTVAKWKKLFLNKISQ